MITILSLASKQCSGQSSERNPSGSMDDPRYNTKNRRYNCENCIVGESHPYLCRHCVLGSEDAAFSCRHCSIGTVTPQWTAADTPFNCRDCRSKELNYGNIRLLQIRPSNANNRYVM